MSHEVTFLKRFAYRNYERLEINIINDCRLLQPAVAVAGSLVHYDACARDVLQ